MQAGATWVWLFIFMNLAVNTFGQQNTENVVLITVDGLRWQELFRGADPSIIRNGKFVKNISSLQSVFWAGDVQSRRARLFPFLWSTIAREGQIYGNRDFGSKVNVANRYRFSYPGYNELLTGRADKRIRSNAKRTNPNQTILEFANQQSRFKGRVAAFASWDVFHYIINTKRSGIHLNAGSDTAESRLTARERYINHLQRNTPSPWKGIRFDDFTHSYAREYLKKNSPRLMLIAYGETDEFAHMGAYDEYLKAAYKADQYIRDIWEWIQSDSRYQNKTTMIITTDHGRGNGRRSWRHHGAGRIGSNHTWFAVIGPDTVNLGEVKEKSYYYTNQLTKTIASLLKLKFPEVGSGGSALVNAR